MTVSQHTAESIHKRLLSGTSSEALHQRLRPRPPAGFPLKPRLPGGGSPSHAAMATRRNALAAQGILTDRLAECAVGLDPAQLSGNIENMIGCAQIPVGVIGPLRINGSAAFGDYYVPLATSEGALVASYNRGAYVISQAGGATALCLTEAVSRAPCFLFPSMIQSAQFLAWVLDHVEDLQAIVSAGSRHCRLSDVRPSLIGKDVYIAFDYQTGDASGQNMVTLATEAVCNHIIAQCPIKPLHWYVEANLSGDKKATMLAFLYARGKKVVAETVLPPDLMRRFLHVTPEAMHRYWVVSFMGGAQSGSIGVQGHFANALAALFIACGQDAACVSEAAIGMTRMDVQPDGSLYVAVTLPNLIVGTVGGGTRLPTARECLAMLDCNGEGSARALAEICAATALAGEISIIAALAANEFASAHARYGRPQAERKTNNRPPTSDL